MIIVDLKNAVIGKYQSSVELRNIFTGGFYFQQAPQNTDAPYAVFVINGIEQMELMGTADDNITNANVTFELYTKAVDDGDDIDMMIKGITEAFDWVHLPINNWHLVKVQRDGIEPLIYEDEFWQTSINYIIGLQKE